jgi:hypothetical protein
MQADLVLLAVGLGAFLSLHALVHLLDERVLERRR